MPTSYHGYITDVVEEVRKLQPKTVLDIGIGFGKWGHLFREYLDVMNGRVFKKDWTTKIDGVEIFEPYIMDHQRNIYDTIHIGDILKVIDSLPQYDVIFTSDVLEHLPKEQGLELVQKVRRKCKHFIAAVPMGDVWLNSQGSMYGNDHEAHISSWASKDFIPFQSEKQFMCNKKPINLYIMRSEDRRVGQQ